MVDREDWETSFERSTHQGVFLFYTSDPEFYSYIQPLLVKYQAELEHTDNYGMLFYIDKKYTKTFLKAYKKFYGKDTIIND